MDWCVQSFKSFAYTFRWRLLAMLFSLLIYLLLHSLRSSFTDNLQASQYYISGDIAINCGSSGISAAFNGREWVGDIGSKPSSSPQPNGKSLSSTAVHLSLSADPVPYMTARISHSPFFYTFRVSPGQKFIRLHFSPASYRGFERSKDLFSVEAGPFTLLSNFSASITADALGLKSFVKEFCLNIEENQVLNITLSPSRRSISDDVYAFINGLEIVPMPDYLYYSRHGDLGAHAIGWNYQFHIDGSMALELVQRLNVGGVYISPMEDSGMFREWLKDTNYLLESGLVPVNYPTTMIRKEVLPIYTAPLRVYQTSWTRGPNKQLERLNSFTWKLYVDLGFKYLVRLHFCAQEPLIFEEGLREFDIFINNKIAETSFDIIRWSSGEGIPVHRDYIVMMKSNRKEGRAIILVTIQFRKEDVDGHLTGLEVFKLSNDENSFASPNPVSVQEASSSWTKGLRQLILSVGRRNQIATVAILLMTALNIIVYKLQNHSDTHFGPEKQMPSTAADKQCRRFSLAEIRLATQNFSEALFIGKGGFGRVYKGFISNLNQIVAVKRLKWDSKQGAHEFWTEIETLSQLRHIHLVSLIGYCNAGHEMVLVYEYMPRGTLADHLYRIDRKNDDYTPLTWEQRLRVCIGAARGLDYLHSGTEFGVIHRDVKASNILLDENFVAKISDFGLSKLEKTTVSHAFVSTRIKGTVGYIDPEYVLTQKLTRKTDVYAFGVVMLEVLCGRPAMDSRLEEDQRSLALWARDCIRNGKVDQILAPSLRGQIPPDSLKTFVEIADSCLHKKPKKRPTMAQVAARIEYELHRLENVDFVSQDVTETGLDLNNSPTAPHSDGGEQMLPYIAEQDVHPTSGESSKSKLDVLPNSEESSKSKLVEHAATSSTKKSGHASYKKRSWWRWWNRTKLLEKKVDIPLEFDLCRQFSFRDIKAATKNFDDNFMIGGFSTIYKGFIDDGSPVAIKMWSGLDDFENEVKMSSKLRHVNIVPLIGYCTDKGEKISVYDYMDRGALNGILHNTGSPSIPWRRRLDICIGAAKGLQYLHTGLEDPIIHCDIKSSNILLDGEWVAKLNNFQLSRSLRHGNISDKVHVNISDIVHVTTAVRGTFGYLDPEFLFSSQLTTKSDVYSFGVVLLEVLCARPAVSSYLDDEQYSLATWALHCYKRGSLDQIVDPHIKDEIAPECLRKYAELALSCLNLSAAKRPDISGVVRGLELALQLQEHPEMVQDDIDTVPFAIPSPSQHFLGDRTVASPQYVWDTDVSSGSTTLTGR